MKRLLLIISSLITLGSCSKEYSDTQRPKLQETRRESVVNTLSPNKDSIIKSRENSNSVSSVSLTKKDTLVVSKNKKTTSIKKTEKKEVIVIEKKEPVRAVTLKPIEKFDYIPNTVEEIIEKAKYHYKEAKRLVDNNNDSSLIHIDRSISLQQNGSSHALRSYILLKKKRWTEAENAASRAINQRSYWDEWDSKKAAHTRMAALDSLYHVMPSQLTKKHAEKAKEYYEKLF